MNAKKVVHWSLAVLIAAYLLTGFGITQHDIVEAITFGLLTTSLAFTIHSYLWIPLLIVLALHIALVVKPRKKGV
jgi:hypothetical protein